MFRRHSRFSVTDAGNGTVGYTYNSNDVLQTLGPAPTGENTKRKQMEYDGLGRLTSVCEVTTVLSGSGTCFQTASQTGYWAVYSYDALGDLVQILQSDQGGSQNTQNRTYLYDGLGRMTSERNPETGTISYTYDTDATCGTSNGDLVKRVDAMATPDVTCYAYDALHRVTSVTYPSGSYAANTPSKTFVYDVSTASGFTLSNTKGRLAEAYTGPSASKITDLVFSYSARGEVTDAYQSTPHSAGYYHTTAAYWANGAVSGVGGLPAMPSLSYNVDGEGRVSSASDSTPRTLGTVTGYNVFGQATGVTLGSADSDAFTFDPNTGRMTQYKYTVGSTPQTVTGNLTWNANGTLGTLAITDQLNAANTQTCSYGYDDIARLGSVTCANGATKIWGQSFGFDPFGNLTKNLISGYPGTSFTPTYGSTNQITSSPFTYDANGNTTHDNVHTYTWDAEGKALSADTISLTYDALGRMVEQNATTQIVYAPTGQKYGLMTGQTVTKMFVPLPAGAQAVYTGTTPAYYRHSDWLGSSRLSTTPSRTVYSSLAYAPFGETYAESGTPDRSFTGQNQDTISGGTAGLYDFLFREYAQYGRWVSPDPSGMSAVTTTNPQTWNRYAYVANNPLVYFDRLGLDCIYLTDDGEHEEDRDPGQCDAGSGGYYVPGTVIGSIQIDSQNDTIGAYSVANDSLLYTASYNGEYRGYGNTVESINLGGLYPVNNEFTWASDFARALGKGPSTDPGSCFHRFASTVTAPVKQLQSAAKYYVPLFIGSMQSAPSLSEGFGNYMRLIGAFTSTPPAETAEDVTALRVLAGGAAAAAPYVSAAAPYVITGGADVMFGYALRDELKAGANGQCHW